jgi:NTE family protein
VPDADLVLEGGGAKGLGIVGAVTHLLEAGYRFPRVAGTSAGSIVAALLAAGADARGLAESMNRLEYLRVPDRGGVPVASAAASFFAKGGLHSGEYVHEWIRVELERLDVRTFADLPLVDADADPNLDDSQRYRLVVMATDITHGCLLRLPWDYKERFGLEPGEQSVADAVRASISIPLYFVPRMLTDERTGEEATLVDGGVLSNFPVEVFDRTDGRLPRRPTFGVKVIPALPGADDELVPELGPVLALSNAIPPFREAEQVLATAIVGHDQTYIRRPCVRRRMIEVDTSGIGITEFDADERKRADVVAKGREAATRFLEDWDWTGYLRDCRGAVDTSA